MKEFRQNRPRTTSFPHTKAKKPTIASSCAQPPLARANSVSIWRRLTARRQDPRPRCSPPRSPELCPRAGTAASRRPRHRPTQQKLRLPRCPRLPDQPATPTTEPTPRSWEPATLHRTSASHQSRSDRSRQSLSLCPLCPPRPLCPLCPPAVCCARLTLAVTAGSRPNLCYQRSAAPQRKPARRRAPRPARAAARGCCCASPADPDRGQRQRRPGDGVGS